MPFGVVSGYRRGEGAVLGRPIVTSGGRRRAFPKLLWGGRRVFSCNGFSICNVFSEM